MAESKATAPDFVMTLEVDMEEAVALRGQLKAAAGDDPAPSFNDFVVKAAALALRDFPRANGAYRDGQFELYSRVNVGVAVAGQDALVVPTVFDADKKSLGAIAAESRRLAERVREGKITPPELSAGTFTVSNLGMYGIRRFVAVINPPQAAILAVGELSPRPVVRDGEVVVRALMELTLDLRPPDPLRRRRRRVPGQDPRVPRDAAEARALARTRAADELLVRLARGIARDAGRRLVGVDEQAERQLAPGPVDAGAVVLVGSSLRRRASPAGPRGTAGCACGPRSRARRT